MIHFFDADIAKQYGVNAAVLLYHIAYWIKHNEANGTNYYDGNFWTYNSMRAFAELFPYMSERQISTALSKLIDDGVIVTGNYNKSTYDRTLWYALTQKGKCIMQKCKMDTAEMSNGLCGNVKPIPDNIPNNKPDNKHNIYTEEVEEIVSYLNEKAGTKYRAKTEATRRHIVARLNDGFSVDDFKEVIDKKCAGWIGTDYQKYLRPETLFGSKFESYLNENSKRKEANPYAGIDAADAF